MIYPGTQFGPYYIDRELGRGGMAQAGQASQRGHGQRGGGQRKAATARRGGGHRRSPGTAHRRAVISKAHIRAPWEGGNVGRAIGR